MTHPTATKTNFTKQSNEFFQDGHSKVIKGIGKVIYDYLCYKANFNEDHSAEVTYTQIARDCGVGSNSTISTHLKNLADWGYVRIEKTQRGNTIHQRCVYYILELPKISATKKAAKTKDVSHLTKAKVEKRLNEISVKQNQPVEGESELYKQYLRVHHFSRKGIDRYSEAQFYRIPFIKAFIAKYGEEKAIEAYCAIANYCVVNQNFGKAVNATDYLFSPEKMIEWMDERDAEKELSRKLQLIRETEVVEDKAKDEVRKANRESVQLGNKEAYEQLVSLNRFDAEEIDIFERGRLNRSNLLSGEHLTFERIKKEINYRRMQNESRRAAEHLVIAEAAD